jgi:hypothetical protein
MDTLAKHIEEELKKRRFCVVSADELERYFPQTEKTKPAVREREIRTFAESYDWIVLVADTRAIFARKDAPFLA